MKLIRCFLALSLIVACTSIGSAHEPPGELYFAFQFPLHAVPTIDGDISDWDMLDPEVFEISVERGHIQETVRGDDSGELSDFNARSMWAWNEEMNRVFSFAFVVDDHLDNDRDDPTIFNWDDDWHFVLDADHSGGDMFTDDWNQLDDAERRAVMFVTGQLWQIHVPPIDGYWAFKYIEATDWETTGRELPFPEFSQVGWSRTGETGGPGTYTYEIMMTPWETWSWDGPEQSTIVDLEVGNIIHVGSLSKDYDTNPDRYEGGYDFPAIHNVWRNANLMADMELLEVDDSLFPTSVENDSWGRIKSHYLLEE